MRFESKLILWSTVLVGSVQNRSDIDIDPEPVNRPRST